MLYRFIRSAVGFLTIVGFIFVSLSSQNVVSAEKSQSVEYESRLDDFLHTQMDTYKIPGLAIAIVRNGEVEYLNGYGNANPDGDPVTPDTPFLLASVSKSFTALAIMQLVEDGKIALNDPVQKHLPWFDVKGKGESEITVAHLVYQTSGFSEYDGNEINLLPESPNGREESVRASSNISLTFKPGDGWEYSNINYNILGVLVQEMSGQRYEDYIQEHIFDPLSMGRSYTSLADAWDAGAARGYNPFFGIPLAVESRVTNTVGASAGLWSSAADVSRYLIAHLDEEAEILISVDGMKQLHTPGAEIEPGFNYAMGWFHAPNVLEPEFLQTLNTNLNSNDDLQVLWHEGDWKGYKSMVLLLPGQEYGVALLMNINDATVSSVYKNFAWDVTLIANGGEAYYFQPSEKFIVRHSRWIFSGLAFVLLLGLAWSCQQTRRTGTFRRTWLHKLFVILNLGLMTYIHLKLMPDNNTSLRGVMDRSPDLGILAILVTVFSVGWMVVSAGILLKLRSK